MHYLNHVTHFREIPWGIVYCFCFLSAHLFWYSCEYFFLYSIWELIISCLFTPNCSRSYLSFHWHIFLFSWQLSSDFFYSLSSSWFLHISHRLNCFHCGQSLHLRVMGSYHPVLPQFITIFLSSCSSISLYSNRRAFSPFSCNR